MAPLPASDVAAVATSDGDVLLVLPPAPTVLPSVVAGEASRGRGSVNFCSSQKSANRVGWKSAERKNVYCKIDGILALFGMFERNWEKEQGYNWRLSKECRENRMDRRLCLFGRNFKFDKNTKKNESDALLA